MRVTPSIRTNLDFGSDTYLGAAIRAAMKDPELVAEYLKAGVYFDPKLTDPSRMQANLNAYVEAERAFYVKWRLPE